MISSDLFHNKMGLVDTESVGVVLVLGVGILLAVFGRSLASQCKDFCHSANSR